MTINLTEKTLVHAMWFANIPGGDILAALWKPENDGWRFDIRIRTDGAGNPDPHAPDNTDKKSWLRATLEPGVDLDKKLGDFSKTLHNIVDNLGGAGTVFDEVRLACRGDEAVKRLLAEYPQWMNVRQVH